MGEDALATTFCGSPIYMSPEVLQNKPYSYASDVWSLGCIFYEMLAGYNPYSKTGCTGVIDLSKYIKDKEVPEVSVAFGGSDETRDVLRQMMSKDPSRRPPPSALREMVGELHVQQVNATWLSSRESDERVSPRSLVQQLAAPRLPAHSALSSKETARNVLQQLHAISGVVGMAFKASPLSKLLGGGSAVPSFVRKNVPVVVSRGAGRKDARSAAPREAHASQSQDGSGTASILRSVASQSAVDTY
eukprot:gene30227-37400_t